MLCLSFRELTCGASQTTYGKQLQKQLEDVTKESSSSSKRWNTNNLFQRNDRPVVRLSTEEKRLHRATVVAILRGLDPAATDVQCQVAIAQWEFAVYGNLSTDRSADHRPPSRTNSLFFLLLGRFVIRRWTCSA